MSDFVDSNEGVNEEAFPDEVAAMFDLKQKKKKKKKKESSQDDKKKSTDDEIHDTEDNAQSGISEVTDAPTYTYLQLLERVTELLHQNNPELTEKRRHTMKPPQLMRGMFFYVINFFLNFFLKINFSWNEKNVMGKFSRNL